MDHTPEPPPIVVTRTMAILKSRRKRHPVKSLMVAVALLWPFAIIASTAGLTAIAKRGARLQNDGNYYVWAPGGWSRTSLFELFIGSLACGGVATTLFFAGVMAILWVVWWATKE